MTKAFELRHGQRPYAVFLAGVLKIEGETEDYTVVNDAGVWSVVFAVAPASAADVIVWPQEA